MMAKTRSKTSSLTRSQTMARVKSANTAPELTVRRALHAAGLRYRLHRADLPGKPDVVLPGKGAAVFIHGCFWHSHLGCPRARTPSTRKDYWESKLKGNVVRDRRAVEALTGAGWEVHVIWECEVKDAEKLHELITAIRKPN